MKIFAIRDESSKKQSDLAYLIYYETEKRFYIELPKKSDPWEVPLLLDSFVKRNETSVNSYWSKIWVQQRIIPPDRQNIGEILRDNHLKEYDEYALLMLSMGRCAQDSYYLVPLDENDLPDEMKERFDTKIEDLLPLDNNNLLVFFRNGLVKKCNMKSYFETVKAFHILIDHPEFFEKLQIMTGGHGISWDLDLTVSASMLYSLGKEVPLTVSDFRRFVSERVVTASEAAKILDCSRQNINDLTKHGKLRPLKSSEKNTLYLKSEILKRNWQ